MENLFSKLAAAAQAGEQALPPPINDSFTPNLALEEFDHTWQLPEIATYEEKVRRIVVEGLSLAVHTDYRYVPDEQQVALGVGGQVFSPEEKRLSAGWVPAEAKARFNPALCTTALPTGYRSDKHEDDLEALRLVWDTPTLTYNNLHWFKTNMSQYIPLLTAYKKRHTLNRARRSGKLSHKMFAEYTTLIRIVSDTSARVQQIAIEYNTYMGVHANTQTVLALRRKVLRAAEDGANIDSEALPGESTACSGQGKRKRPLISASAAFGGDDTDITMRGKEEIPIRVKKPLT